MGPLLDFLCFCFLTAFIFNHCTYKLAVSLGHIYQSRLYILLRFHFAYVCNFVWDHSSRRRVFDFPLSQRLVDLGIVSFFCLPQQKKCLNHCYLPFDGRFTPIKHPNEPRHDKTNKMSVRPAKTQINLDIRPVWSESSLSAWRKAWVLSYALSAKRRLWSGWADAQADLSLHWAHSHFVGFVMSRLKCDTWTCPSLFPELLG